MVSKKPDADPTYFHPLLLAKCLQDDLRRAYPGSSLQKALNEANRRRDDWAQGNYDDWFVRIISKSLFMHGMALVNHHPLADNSKSVLIPEGETRRPWFQQTDLLDSLAVLMADPQNRKAIAEGGDGVVFEMIKKAGPPRSAEKKRHTLDLITKRFPGERPFSAYDQERQLMDIDANSLIEWLLTMKRGSVTHYQLYAKAKEIYGDPLAALGVISHMFDQERMLYGYHGRKQYAVLGNKMKSFLPRDQIDSVGYNYHFWAYLNLALLGDEKAASVFNQAFQWEKEKDLGDFSANYWGLFVGANAMRGNLSDIACPSGDPAF